jgi:hypothetical protein
MLVEQTPVTVDDQRVDPAMRAEQSMHRAITFRGFGPF